MHTGISVIICCHNSAGRLPKTISHLANQKLKPDLKWEIIIVDNASTDHTREVATKEWNKNNLKIPFYIIQELKPGLSFAREAGISQAKFSLILFCDDDNWLDANYLEQAYQIMQQNPTMGCLGGYNEAVADVPLPNWFKTYEPAYACGPQNDKEGWLKDRFYICGAGMVVNRSVFELMKKVDFTSLLSDRVGSSLNSGGDNEISLVALMMGYGLYYTPQLKLKHYMPSNRLSWDYLVRMNKGHSKSWYLTDLYKDIYLHKPLKKSWLYEGAIRLFYFLKEKPGQNFWGWVTVKKHEGDEKRMGSFMVTEKLISHFLNLNYKNHLLQIENLYKRIKNKV